MIPGGTKRPMKTYIYRSSGWAGLSCSPKSAIHPTWKTSLALEICRWDHALISPSLPPSKSLPPNPHYLS